MNLTNVSFVATTDIMVEEKVRENTGFGRNHGKPKLKSRTSEFTKSHTFKQ